MFKSVIKFLCLVVWCELDEDKVRKFLLDFLLIIDFSF